MANENSSDAETRLKIALQSAVIRTASLPQKDNAPFVLDTSRKKLSELRRAFNAFEKQHLSGNQTEAFSAFVQQHLVPQEENERAITALLLYIAYDIKNLPQKNHTKLIEWFLYCIQLIRDHDFLKQYQQQVVENFLSGLDRNFHRLTQYDAEYAQQLLRAFDPTVRETYKKRLRDFQQIFSARIGEYSNPRYYLTKKNSISSPAERITKFECLLDLSLGKEEGRSLVSALVHWMGNNPVRMFQKSAKDMLDAVNALALKVPRNDQPFYSLYANTLADYIYQYLQENSWEWGTWWFKSNLACVVNTFDDFRAIWAIFNHIGDAVKKENARKFLLRYAKTKPDWDFTTLSEQEALAIIQLALNMQENDWVMERVVAPIIKTFEDWKKIFFLAKDETDPNASARKILLGYAKTKPDWDFTTLSEQEALAIIQLALNMQENDWVMERVVAPIIKTFEDWKKFFFLANDKRDPDASVRKALLGYVKTQPAFDCMRLNSQAMLEILTLKKVDAKKIDDLVICWLRVERTFTWSQLFDWMNCLLALPSQRAQNIWLHLLYEVKLEDLLNSLKKTTIMSWSDKTRFIEAFLNVLTHLGKNKERNAIVEGLYRDYFLEDSKKVKVLEEGTPRFYAQLRRWAAIFGDSEKLEIIALRNDLLAQAKANMPPPCSILIPPKSSVSEAQDPMQDPTLLSTDSDDSLATELVGDEENNRASEVVSPGAGPSASTSIPITPENDVSNKEKPVNNSLPRGAADTACPPLHSCFHSPQRGAGGSSSQKSPKKRCVQFGL